MRISRLLLLVLLLAPVAAARGGKRAPPRWTKDRTGKLTALAREYLAVQAKFGKRYRERDEILARARALGPFPAKLAKTLVKELMKVARSGPKSDGKGTCRAKYPPFPGVYYLSGTGGGKKGIFIGLHGGGPGVGDGRSAAGQWGGAAGKGLIGVFPTANLPGRQTTWYSPDVEGFVLAIVMELKRTYRIDANRIYIAGHSLGGSGAWSIGLKHADLFAGVSPNAGGCHGIPKSATENQIPGGYVANLLNTPIFITHYDRDPRVGVKDARAAVRELDLLAKEYPGGYEHVYIEGKGVSHGFPPGGNPGRIIDWLTKHRRNPYPARVVWEPSGRSRRLFSWLRLASPMGEGSRDRRIVAAIAKNRVEITGNALRGLSILLAEKMIDPKKVVTVLVNGKKRFEGVLSPDPAALLECVMENIDPEQIFLYRVDL